MAVFITGSETVVDWPTLCSGTGPARSSTMAGVRKFEDLSAWQLASSLAVAVFRLTERGDASGDRAYQEQIRRAADSAPANIAEGFGRFRPREFAQFLRIARASLLETRSHILSGQSKGYFSDADAGELLRIQDRATGATTKLVRYLDACKGQPPAGWDGISKK